jgi:hypothetical protein
MVCRGKLLYGDRPLVKRMAFSEHTYVAMTK